MPMPSKRLRNTKTWAIASCAPLPKPSFNKFFNNVGDQAAGEFIRGTGLAFLCSPFQMQIRIAVAQSYARRGAASCTLTGVIKNINSFMNGNFSQGGWGGLLQFT